MKGKRLVAVAVLMCTVAACTPQPPPYESRYTPPLPAAPPPPPLPPGSSFVDDFERPDTQQGLGVDWDVREAREVNDGNPALVPTTDGFIRDGQYASSGDVSVYALRKFRSDVRRIGAEARWMRVGDGAAETLMMAITANDNILSDLVQLSVSPTGWAVKTRRGNGKVRNVINGMFDRPLEFDRNYRFEMDAADGSVTVRVPGAERVAKVGTVGLISERAFWRHIPPAVGPAGSKFTADMVWVAEQAQPLSPIPADE